MKPQYGEQQTLLSSGTNTSIRPQAAQIADALTVLEGRNYSRIRPADYLFDLLPGQRSDRVECSRTTTQKVTFWVQHSLLCPCTQITHKVELLKFFICIAMVSCLFHIPLLSHTIASIDNPLLGMSQRGQFLIHGRHQQSVAVRTRTTPLHDVWTA